jgi:hypothetical protein
LPVNLSGSAKIHIIENQYVSLTEGDSIISITADNSTSGDIIGLDNDWVDITGASYKFAGEDSTTVLPSIDITDLS